MADAVNSTQDQNQRLSDLVNQANATKTARGTKIVKAGQDMDRNAFLRILSAELSNQDPQNAKDGTEYVAQMAQFAGLEQMANLNSTMRVTSANGLIGKIVSLRKLDDNGKLYSGEVKDIIKDGDSVKVDVAVGKEKDKDGNIVDTIKEFAIEDVIGITNNSKVPNTANSSMNLLNAAALIGKGVELDEKDSSGSNYTGIVKQVSRDANGIKVTVQTSSGETKDFTFDKVIRVKDS